MKYISFTMLTSFFLLTNSTHAENRITLNYLPIPGYESNSSSDQQSYWEKQREDERTREEEKRRYQSSTGTNYQYNLNNVSDRISYSLDLDAQRRDQMSINPSRNLDSGIGQFGGGIID